MMYSICTGARWRARRHAVSVVMPPVPRAAACAAGRWLRICRRDGFHYAGCAVALGVFAGIAVVQPVDVRQDYQGVGVRSGQPLHALKACRCRRERNFLYADAVVFVHNGQCAEREQLLKCIHQMGPALRWSAISLPVSSIWAGVFGIVRKELVVKEHQLAFGPPRRRPGGPVCPQDVPEAPVCLRPQRWRRRIPALPVCRNWQRRTAFLPAVQDGGN